MGLFNKKNYFDDDAITETDNTIEIPTFDAESEKKSEKQIQKNLHPEKNVNFEFRPDKKKPIRLGARAINQIAQINAVAEKNGWLFLIDFSDQSVVMHFESRNYSIACHGVDYSNFDLIPTGASIADLVTSETSGYDEYQYVYRKESKMIVSKKMINSTDVEQFKREADEIRKNINGLVDDLKNVEPINKTQKISVEDFGKKHSEADEESDKGKEQEALAPEALTEKSAKPQTVKKVAVNESGPEKKSCCQ